jgi:hypothetical protein
MKLSRLTVANFLRLQEFDFDLSTHVAHLFCGPNEAGKSTVAEAVRFALLGDSPRIALKKNFPSLINRGGGAKKGSVSLIFDKTSVSRDVGSGKADSDFKLEKHQETCIRIAMGAQGFVDLTPDERRDFLYVLCEVSLSADDIVKRMVEFYDVSEAMATRYKPMLVSGIDTALKAAEADQQRLRAQWESIAGEKYGTQKAEGWKPQVAAGGKRPIQTNAEDLAKIEAKIADMQRQNDALTQALGIRQATATRKIELERDIGNARTDAAAVTSAERLLADVNAQIETMQADISTNADLLQRAEVAAKALNCPSCDAPLKFNDDMTELEPLDPDALNFVASPAQIEAERAKLRAANGKLDALRAKAKEYSGVIERGRNATAAIQDLQSKIDALKPHLGSAEDIERERSVLRAACHQATQNLQAMRNDNEAIEKLRTAEQSAGEVHKKMCGVAKAIDALSADGIKADILEECLAPLNQRMLTSAHLAGWPAPTINADMDIVREDGLLYELLSESARWRLSAVIADAIASMSGFKLLILDRMDVLDLPSRQQALKWISILADDSFDAILVMATLKEPPKGIPSSINAVWLG